jgi:hypothetical protein
VNDPKTEKLLELLKAEYYGSEGAGHGSLFPPEGS